MMRRMWILAMLLALLLAGCGNVRLSGEALTAAETSAMDAYQATHRAAAEPAAPSWVRVYLEENYKQWRFFVRAARKDSAWGPKLEGE